MNLVEEVEYCGVVSMMGVACVASVSVWVCQERWKKRGKEEQRGRGEEQALAQKTHNPENAPWWLGLFVDRQLVNIYSFLSFLNMLYMITEAYNGACIFVI